LMPLGLKYRLGQKHIPRLSATWLLTLSVAWHLDFKLIEKHGLKQKSSQRTSVLWLLFYKTFFQNLKSSLYQKRFKLI